MRFPKKNSRNGNKAELCFNYWPRGTLESIVCNWSGCRGFFFFPPLRLTHATAEVSTVVIIKLLGHIYDWAYGVQSEIWVIFTDDLDAWPWPLKYFCILSHNSVPAGENISKFLLSVALAMAILQMIKISLAVCTNSIYGYIMFSDISQKRVFGRNFWIKAARMMIFSLNERSCQALHSIFFDLRALTNIWGRYVWNTRFTAVTLRFTIRIDMIANSNSYHFQISCTCSAMADAIADINQ